MKQKQRKRERERRIFRARETHVPSENPTGRLHSTWNLFPHSWQGILDGCSLPLRGGGAQGGKHFTIRVSRRLTRRELRSYLLRSTKNPRVGCRGTPSISVVSFDSCMERLCET
uniref:Uncharacterized protein n=1 Tax=Physcomitrium patens TaxID=3218 RepID=A0A2K1K661_PHYPA|nr:hypothetical protein PHYPA_011148 [Physcomitrium patens]